MHQWQRGGLVGDGKGVTQLRGHPLCIIITGGVDSGHRAMIIDGLADAGDLVNTDAVVDGIACSATATPQRNDGHANRLDVLGADHARLLGKDVTHHGGTNKMRWRLREQV